MSRIAADSQRQLRASFHDRAEMFETMADAFALSGGVLEQDLQLAKTQTLARDLKTERTNLQSIFLRTTARAAGMHHEVIDPERNRSFDLFTKGFDRLEQD